MMKQVSIGLVGGGTVGCGVFQALERNRELIASRLGLHLDVERIAVRDASRPRPVTFPSDKVTTDWREVVHDPKVRVVAELVGGTQVAHEIVLEALRLGKPVVTANKALISTHGESLFAAARAHHANLYYEASVAGGIPIIKLLRESLVANRFSQLVGIVNGTCNFILSRMKRDGCDFDVALAEAQRRGYAEAEPSLDIDGHDAGHKTGILASLAHGFWVQPSTVHVEGIRSISSLDIQFADRLGYTIRLLGVVRTHPTTTGLDRETDADAIEVAVYPALVPNDHVLASVQDEYNAIAIRGDVVGETLFYGKGAGAEATASSVISDLADASLDLKFGSQHRVPAFMPHGRKGNIIPQSRTQARTYLRLQVLDRPGVFARIASLLGDAGIGISSIFQPEGHAGETVPVVLMLHQAPLSALQTSLQEMTRLDVVQEPPRMIRVETLS